MQIWQILKLNSSPSPLPKHTHDLTLFKIELPFKIQLQHHHESG